MDLKIHPLTADILNGIEMSSIQERAHEDVHQFISMKAGVEHYRLLTHISLSNNNIKILDLGTFKGWSALALAANPTNHVITYDLVDLFEKSEKQRLPNITYKIKNLLDDLDELRDVSLIMLDVDPHDGKQEREIIDALLRQNFKGVVIMDDINNADFFPELVRYFQELPLRKENVTPIGHHSGTGIVYF
jgi:predicted O-methyltransferase YrrM